MCRPTCGCGGVGWDGDGDRGGGGEGYGYGCRDGSGEVKMWTVRGRILADTSI